MPTGSAEPCAQQEIRKVHQTGRPMLVGTASVEDSEALSHRFHAAGIPHSVLNARNDELEAEIDRPGGSTRGSDDLDQHGGSRHRHPAGWQSSQGS